MPLRPRSPAAALVLVLLAIFAWRPETSVAARPGGDTASAPTKPSLPRGLVVVLRPAELTETMRVVLARITGELAAASFQVRVESLDPQKDPTQQIQAAALEADAVAAFALGGSRDSLAIWIFERPGHRTTIQRVPVRRGGFAQDAKVSALKAVELIRASLADLWPEPAPAPAFNPLPAPAPVPTPAAAPAVAPPAPPPPPSSASLSPPSGPPSPSSPLDPTAPIAFRPATSSVSGPSETQPPSPPRPEEAPSPSVIESAAGPPPATGPAGPPWPPLPRLAVGLGVASLWDLRSTPQWMGSLQVERRFSPRLALQARIAGLGSSLAIPATGASAAVERERGSLGAAWAFWTGTRVYVSLVAGLGAEHVRGSGNTSDRTQSSHAATAWLPIVLGGLSATVRLATHWSATVRLEGEWAWSRVDLAIGETRTEPLVRPGALSELAIQAFF